MMILFKFNTWFSRGLKICIFSESWLKKQTNKNLSPFLALILGNFLQSILEPVLNGHSKVDKAKILMTNGSLLKVETITECSLWSILQCFWPALSDNWSWKLNFRSFLEWPFYTGFAKKFLQKRVGNWNYFYYFPTKIYLKEPSQ